MEEKNEKTLEENNEYLEIRAEKNEEKEDVETKENTIFEKIITNEDPNKLNIDINRRKSDPNTYELEHECDIDNIDKVMINEKYIKKKKKIETIKDPENLKINKEYKDTNEDLTSIRFKIKHNNNDYLIVNEDNNKNMNTNDKTISDNEYESDKDEEEKKEDLPFSRIIPFKNFFKKNSKPNRPEIFSNQKFLNNPISTYIFEPDSED